MEHGFPDFANEGCTPDQQTTFSITAWLSRADRDGAFLNPDLSPLEVEGWILGVPSLIRTGTLVSPPLEIRSA
jgi:hypothetical protein